jgi:hypothetical protein
MNRPILSIVLSILAYAFYVGGQIGWRELSNIELHDDLVDLAAQAGAWIGLYSPRTDNQIRAQVIERAKDEDIRLKPEQISVTRTGKDKNEAIHLAVEYQTEVNLGFGHSFTMHFIAEGVRTGPPNIR